MKEELEAAKSGFDLVGGIVTYRSNGNCVGASAEAVVGRPPTCLSALVGKFLWDLLALVARLMMLAGCRRAPSSMAATGTSARLAETDWTALIRASNLGLRGATHDRQ